MKITMKAMLINGTSENKQIIDNMMLVFCTAIRFSFKRLLENSIKITELEKVVASSKRCSRISKTNYSISKRIGKNEL